MALAYSEGSEIDLNFIHFSFPFMKLGAYSNSNISNIYSMISLGLLLNILFIESEFY